MILELKSLCKDYRNHWTYRRIPVLHDLTLEMEEGEVFGLIGPNGAGKTTTFKCLMGFLRPTRGTIVFLGSPMNTAARAAIGFLPEQPYFYDHLTVRETLEFYGRLYGMNRTVLGARIDELATELNFDHKLRAPLRTLSKGNLQRVGVAQAVLHRPRLAILDEPMSGLDPSGRKQMRELIQRLHHEGTTVIFSSHILSDTELLCDRVGILAGGTLREIIDIKRGTAASGFRLTVRDAPAELAHTLSELAKSTKEEGGGSVFVFADYAQVRRAIDAVNQFPGAQIAALAPASPSLEEKFLQHVGQHHQPD